MSEDRRGTDGGEHPLDVDARFADIIAHFHDGEPDRPRLVDDVDDDLGDDVTDDVDGLDDEDDDPDDDPGEGEGPVVVTGPSPVVTGPPPVVTGPPPVVTRLEDADGDRARRERVARIEAEIERAVHGADGGHFVPAEPPPIPRPPDLPGRLAWSAVLLGPVVLLLCALLWDTVRAPSWFVGAVVTGIVVGFGYLVYHLPRTRDRDDPDDGAIV